MRPPLPVVLGLCLPLTVACGGGATVAPGLAHAPRALEAPSPAPASSRDMSVSGLTGTLSQAAVRRGLEPQMDELTGCFVLRSASFAHLGGQIRMRIRVAGDGTVSSAHAEDSTVGDREVERCVRRAISGTRFGPTQGGGEADVRWSLSVDPSAPREPTTLSPERIERAVRRNARRIRERCHAEHDVQVTAYISRRGRVLQAGAASREAVDDATLDCVAARVRRWRLPRGRRIAKVTFDVSGA